MLKKTLILLILLLLLGIYWKLPLIQKSTSKYSVQTNLNQIVLENNIYKIQRQKYNSFNIEIHYPQIQTATFQCDIAQINSSYTIPLHYFKKIPSILNSLIILK